MKSLISNIFAFAILLVFFVASEADVTDKYLTAVTQNILKLSENLTYDIDGVLNTLEKVKFSFISDYVKDYSVVDELKVLEFLRKFDN